MLRRLYLLYLVTISFGQKLTVHGIELTIFYYFLFGLKFSIIQCADTNRACILDCSTISSHQDNYIPYTYLLTNPTPHMT